jgi:hypothetical protein
MAGGKDPDGLDEALALARSVASLNKTAASPSKSDHGTAS